MAKKISDLLAFLSRTVHFTEFPFVRLVLSSKKPDKKTEMKFRAHNLNILLDSLHANIELIIYQPRAIYSNLRVIHMPEGLEIIHRIFSGLIKWNYSY